MQPKYEYSKTQTPSLTCFGSSYIEKGPKCALLYFILSKDGQFYLSRAESCSGMDFHILIWGGGGVEKHLGGGAFSSKLIQLHLNSIYNSEFRCNWGVAETF